MFNNNEQKYDTGNNDVDDKESSNKKANWTWIVAVIMWIIGLSYIKTNTLVAIASLMVGVFSCPVTDMELKKYDFYKKNKILVMLVVLIIWIIGVGNTQNTIYKTTWDEVDRASQTEIDSEDLDIDEEKKDLKETPEKMPEKKVEVDTTNKVSLSEIPPYSTAPYVEINGNVPFFDDSELNVESFEKYSELDNLGRVGIATACIEKGMNDKPRGDIQKVNPTGWQTTKYDGIDGGNLFNRCHIIANQLTGEDDNEKNLMTGTRYFNTQGMERFENQVAEYINNTNNHVLYRVTPMFENEDLVAKGVLIEAKSVEDKGSGIQFNAFCYNVQPGIEIDYKTGNSKKIEKESQPSAVNPVTVVAPITTESKQNVEEKEKATGSIEPKSSQTSAATESAISPTSTSTGQSQESEAQETYILNINSKKFHHAWCSSVNQMKEKNKREYTGTRDSIISQGYSPCGRCSP